MNADRMDTSSLSTVRPWSPDAPDAPSRVTTAGAWLLMAVGGAAQVSIALAQALLAAALVCWVLSLMHARTRPSLPAFCWPLLGYAVWTLVSALASPEPRVSLVDCKQLLLFLIVPATLHLIRGRHADTMRRIVITVGAAAAVYGIFQYGLLHYDRLSQRPQGTLGHYMTYSGILMLGIGAALAQLLFSTKERLWPALLLPALLLGVALTSTRMAWVGVCAASALLLVMKDFRLLAALPLAGAITFAAAGPSITHRLMSMFDANDPTRRDRVAMVIEGAHMVRDHPLTGVGPNRIEHVYPHYRIASAVEAVNPHLHNVPMQIAAERGLPALALWLGFVATLSAQLWQRLRAVGTRVRSAAALAAVAGMLAAGLFEYNFGDSEFLMLFLLLVTLPFCAQDPEETGDPTPPSHA